jgi:phosphatidylethanolamine/phosphatidyl-N-methylethanolamine N-methyltransferase
MVLNDMLSNFLQEMYDKTVLYEPNVILAALMIIICPITWNVVARIEFHTKFFTKACHNDKILAADVFAHLLIEMGVFRNYMYSRALGYVPSIDLPENIDMIVIVLSYILSVVGFIIVAGSYWQLGIHGVYYGDYFGILMKSRVVDFPYNVLDNPMYIGSQTLFFSVALRKKSITGMILVVLVILMYKVASILEMPMTSLIYSEENRKRVDEEDRQLENEKQMQAKGKNKKLK